MSKQYSEEQRAFGGGAVGLFFRAGLLLVLALEIYAEAATALKRLAGLVQFARPLIIEASIRLYALEAFLFKALAPQTFASSLFYPALFVTFLCALALLLFSGCNRRGVRLACAIVLVTILFAGLALSAWRYPSERREAALRICPGEQRRVEKSYARMFN
ncbi:MAG TPA: hypothetical protein VGB17_03085 [Pyrinomonadaceae bacterium]|jgi:hypothetical protein